MGSLWGSIDFHSFHTLSFFGLLLREPAPTAACSTRTWLGASARRSDSTADGPVSTCTPPGPVDSHVFHTLSFFRRDLTWDLHRLPFISHSVVFSGRCCENRRRQRRARHVRGWARVHGVRTRRPTARCRLPEPPAPVHSHAFHVFSRVRERQRSLPSRRGRATTLVHRTPVGARRHPGPPGVRYPFSGRSLTVSWTAPPRGRTAVLRVNGPGTFGPLPGALDLVETRDQRWTDPRTVAERARAGRAPPGGRTRYYTRAK